MSNLRFQNALAQKPQNTPPIWMMRQAGRYHSPYQQLRKEHSFITLCKNAKLAAEVALAPVMDFKFDVSILFSDLLFPLEAIGMGLDYNPAPQLGWHLQEVGDFKKMTPPDKAIDALRFQKEAVEETRKVLPETTSLIGFVGSPWTLFVYAAAGSHKGSLVEVKKRLSLFEPFCELMMPLLKQNIQLQLDGGAEVVMVFDTAAGEMAPETYLQMVSPKVEELADLYPGKLGYYTKGTLGRHLIQVEKKPLAGIGYDQRWHLPDCFGRSPGFTQGNFDQTLLFAPPKEFEMHLMRYLEPLQKLSPEQRKGWVCGLGHGVLPQTPNDNVRLFVDRVREVFGE